jgi:hypothetical protein
MPEYAGAGADPEPVSFTGSPVWLRWQARGRSTQHLTRIFRTLLEFPRGIVHLTRLFHRVSLTERCGAGFQPAVSRISNPQMLPSRYSLPTGSRRYSRWKPALRSLASRRCAQGAGSARAAIPGSGGQRPASPVSPDEQRLLTSSPTMVCGELYHWSCARPREGATLYFLPSWNILDSLLVCETVPASRDEGAQREVLRGGR